MKRTRPLPMATEFEIRSAISDLRGALLDGPRRPNIWAFYSNKNRQLLTLIGDVTFVQAVLLEGDVEVASYSIGQFPTHVEEHYNFGRDLIVQREDGTTHWYFCGRHENLIAKPSEGLKRRIALTKERAQEMGAEFQVRTEQELVSELPRFRNLLALSSALTRSRNFPCEQALTWLIDHLKQQKVSTIRALLARPDLDMALMIGAIARGIFRGYLKCDLGGAPLTLDVELTLAGRREEANYVPCAKADQTPRAVSAPVAVNRRTSCIPEGGRDLSRWPAPDATHVGRSDAYEKNKLAVDMFMAGRDFDAIRRQTGLHEEWVRTLFKKCLAAHADGRINGYRALVIYRREKEFERKKDPPPTNLFRAARSGYAGVLKQLFRRFPSELFKIVEDNVLAIREQLGGVRIPDAKVRWTTLRDEVVAFLRSRGVRDDEYPLNTINKAYSSLADLGRSILFKRPVRFIAARSGRNAGMLAQQGKGVVPLIQATSPLQVVELDFHKHDAAAIVELQTPTEGTLPARVPRWWIGALVDTFDSAILGTADSIEDQTTEVCVLDLIDSAIAPPERVDALRAFRTPDCCWLPNQLCSHFAYVGWDVLRLDRAWAHRSTTVLSALIATTGCAVCYSRPRAWWARSIIERTFAELTARGAQRLPTTYGTGPGDTRKDDPETQAEVMRFRQDEMCHLAKATIREINETTKEGAFWESPMSVCRRAEGMSTYFPRPLPLPFRSDRPTQWATIQIKVEGSVDRGVAPHVRTNRCRFCGPELANAWGLIGKFVYLQVSIHDIRKARVIDTTSGQVIGVVQPEKKWMRYRIGWRLFALIQKHGRNKAAGEEHACPATGYLEEKTEEVRQARGKRRKLKRAAREADKAAKEINATPAPNENNQGLPRPETNDETVVSPFPDFTALLGGAGKASSFSGRD